MKLAILVPDGAYPQVLGAFLETRRPSLGIGPVDYEFIPDVLRDSSANAIELLRPFLRSCTHALVIRDLHGSGWEDRGLEALERMLVAGLLDSGWAEGRAAAIVVEPEIEAWLRFDSTHLRELIRERARRNRDSTALFFQTEINAAIDQNGGLNPLGKPANPKEVFEHLLETFGVQRSNAIYGKLAGSESLRGCVVPSFNRLLHLLQGWFPPP
jgi:hypothetical protein